MAIRWRSRRRTSPFCQASLRRGCARRASPSPRCDRKAPASGTGWPSKERIHKRCRAERSGRLSSRPWRMGRSCMIPWSSRGAACHAPPIRQRAPSVAGPGRSRYWRPWCAGAAHRTHRSGPNAGDRAPAAPSTGLSPEKEQALRIACRLLSGWRGCRRKRAVERGQAPTMQATRIGNLENNSAHIGKAPKAEPKYTAIFTD